MFPPLVFNSCNAVILLFADATRPTFINHFIPASLSSYHSLHSLSPNPTNSHITSCLVEAKAAKVWARAAQSDTERCYETTSSTLLKAPRLRIYSLCRAQAALVGTHLQGYHEARDPSSRSTRRCQAYLRSDLRRDPRCPQGRLTLRLSRPVLIGRSSLRTSSGTPSPTPSTPSERPSRRSTSSTPLSAKDEPSTVSALKLGSA